MLCETGARRKSFAERGRHLTSKSQDRRFSIWHLTFLIGHFLSLCVGSCNFVDRSSSLNQKRSTMQHEVEPRNDQSEMANDIWKISVFGLPLARALVFGHAKNGLQASFNIFVRGRPRRNTNAHSRLPLPDSAATPASSFALDL